MVRFFYIFGVLLIYAFLYLLLKLGLYKKPQPAFVRNFFENAGGSFVKFGQLLALRVDVLPKEYALELINLLDNMRSFPYSEVRKIFIRELGAPPEKIFKDFQKQPFAAASFGQVHPAKLEDDTIVAVKVMRPGIESDVAVDFIFISFLALLGDLFFKIDALTWREFANEFKRWTKNELDYRIEAENTEKIFKFNEKYKSHLIIPKTYHRLTTKKILVQEYIDGIPLSRALRGLRDGRLTAESLAQMGINIKQIPGILVQEILQQYFLFGVFHADPHPGNIILLQNNKIGLIDFGIMGDAISHKKRSFIRSLKGFANMDFEQAVYNASDLCGDRLKRLVDSILPPNLEQKNADEFMHMISLHFSKTVSQIVFGNVKNLEVMKKDYTGVFMEILKAAESYRIKLPREMSVLLRALGMLGMLAKELNYEFKLTNETKKFFDKYPEDLLAGEEMALPYKKINREAAIEQINEWLSYLIEKDPKLYQLVSSYLKKYNKVSG